MAEIADRQLSGTGTDYDPNSLMIMQAVYAQVRDELRARNISGSIDKGTN
jgi:hypothetical protein